MLYLPLEFFIDASPYWIDTNSHFLHQCPWSWRVETATGACVLHYRYACQPFQIVVHWRCDRTPDDPMRRNHAYLDWPYIDLDEQCQHRAFLRPEVKLLDSHGMAINDPIGFRLNDILMAEPLWQLAARNASLWETRYGPMIGEF